MKKCSGVISLFLNYYSLIVIGVVINLRVTTKIS